MWIFQYFLLVISPIFSATTIIIKNQFEHKHENVFRRFIKQSDDNQCNSLNIPNRKNELQIIGKIVQLFWLIYTGISIEKLIGLSRHKPDTVNKQAIGCWNNICLHWRGMPELFQFYYQICSSICFIWISVRDDKIRFWATKLLSIDCMRIIDIYKLCNEILKLLIWFEIPSFTLKLYKSINLSIGSYNANAHLLYVKIARFYCFIWIVSLMIIENFRC